MAKLGKKHREALVSGLQKTRATMNSWMTILFWVSMSLGVLSCIAVILLYTLTERESAAIKLAGITALLFIGAIKLGIDMTRCDLNFQSLELAVNDGIADNITRAIQKFRCFGAIEKFSDELTNYVTRNEQSHGPD